MKKLIIAAAIALACASQGYAMTVSSSGVHASVPSVAAGGRWMPCDPKCN